MTIDHNLLTADMLLGKLPEEQRVEMEQRFFADQALFDELLMAENELTDAYVAGHLTADDRSRFEERFLINPVQRQRAIFADALIKYASREAASNSSERANTMGGIFASLSSIFSMRPLALSFGAAAAVVLVLTAVFLLVNRPGPVTDTDIARVQAPETAVPTAETKENQPPAANETVTVPNANHDAGSRNAPLPKVSTPIRPATMVSTIFLTIGSTRGAAGTKAYNLPAKSTDVRLRLALEDSSFTYYTAVVETVEGRQIVSQRATKRGDSVTLLVPASHLTKGDYIVTLKGSKKNAVPQTIGEYSFTVN